MTPLIVAPDVCHVSGLKPGKNRLPGLAVAAGCPDLALASLDGKAVAATTAVMCRRTSRRVTRLEAIARRIATFGGRYFKDYHEKPHDPDRACRAGTRLVVGTAAGRRARHRAGGETARHR